jgi:hypothetical protein
MEKLCCFSWQIPTASLSQIRPLFFSLFTNRPAVRKYGRDLWRTKWRWDRDFRPEYSDVPLSKRKSSNLSLFVLHRFPRLNIRNKPSEQIHTYNAEDVYELLTSHYQKLTLDDHVEIRKHSAAEVEEEPEPESVEQCFSTAGPRSGTGPWH